MKHDWTDYFLYFWLTLGVLFWLAVVLVAHASLADAESRRAKTNLIQANPQYVSVIQHCSNYDSHCGREFKKILALYDYKACKAVTENICQEWYHPSDLHLIFNSLPGWID